MTLTSDLSISPELAVADPEISEVMSMETGEYLSLDAVVGRDLDKVIQTRMAIKDAQLRERPLYVCAECLVPVYLVMHPRSRRFYFKHTLEDYRCSAVTRGLLSQEEINARKYNGAKESRLHSQMKERLQASLATDRSFSDVKSEKRWKGALDGKWRQPDVQALYHGGPDSSAVRIAFEVQLSTTYLDVIAARRQFYAGERGFLFWIFAEFPDDGRRLTQDDVFFNNNQNAFIVNQESVEASQVLNEFHLFCVCASPKSLRLRRKLVSIKELKFDLVKQQVFYYDYYGAEAEELAKSTAWACERLEYYWLTHGHRAAGDPDEWRDLQGDFRAIGVSLPDYPSHLPTHLLDMLYSAKHGRPVGWEFATFIQVAHWIVASYEQHLEIFRIALRVYNRAGQLRAEDVTEKWRKKVVSYKAAIAGGDPRFAPDLSNDGFISLLFPELFDGNGRRLPVIADNKRLGEKA